MKRFILFGGDSYYASGGFNDFMSDHDTLPEAVRRAEALMNMVNSIEWWHVYDVQAGDVVAHSEVQAYGADDAMENGGKPTMQRR